MDVAAMIGVPEDPAWAVCADRLQALGDPRGELIALEMVPETERSPAHTGRLAELYQPYIERFEAHARALLPGGWLARKVGLWRFGYVVELSLARAMQVPEQPSYSALFGAEELRGLTSLALHLTPDQVEPLLDALERHRPPLAGLMFSNGVEASSNLDEHQCERLWAALPRLEHLWSEGIYFAHFNHPSLRTISVEAASGSAGELSLEVLQGVANSELPQLVRLNFHGSTGVSARGSKAGTPRSFLI